jgi:hypothetical protein
VASPPGFLAAFDSASTMLMATASALHGEPFEALGNPPALKPVVKATGLLPRAARQQAFIASGALETVSPRKMKRLDVEEASEWVVGEYPERRYPAVAIGSSNGAMVNLYAAMGMPWLPQTFLIPVRQRVHPDDPVGAMEAALGPGEDLVTANPDIQLHHMHDAVQDRMMVRALTYFRYKRRTLGRAYERFLRERLEPGGEIVVVECTADWGTTSLGERRVFQHGAVGGASEEEFHEGSERVESYLADHDSPVRRWDEPPVDGRSPEAEWGFAPALRDDIERFAGEHGYRVRRVVFDEPMSVSPMVADLYRWWYARRRIPSSRLFIQSFAIVEPWWSLRTGAVPFWMVFNDETSLAAAHAYLDGGRDFDEIVLALFQNGVQTVGQPDGDEWRDLLARARREGRTAGVDLDRSPFDLPQFATYEEALARTPARYPLPGYLAMADLEAFLAQADPYKGVEWLGPYGP